MSRLPGIVRISLDEYAAAIASALLFTGRCLGAATHAVLPWPPPRLEREMQGAGKQLLLVSDVLSTPSPPADTAVPSFRSLSTAQRLHASRAAASACDAFDGPEAQDPPDAVEVRNGHLTVM